MLSRVQNEMISFCLCPQHLPWASSKGMRAGLEELGILILVLIPCSSSWAFSPDPALGMSSHLPPHGKENELNK